MKLLKPVLLGIFAIASLSLNAQEENSTKTPAEKAEKRAAHIAKEYDLTEEETAKIEAARLDFMNTSKKIKADKTTTKEVKKSQIQAEKVRYSAVVKSVLSDDEFATFEAKMEEKKAKRLERAALEKDPEARAKNKAEKLVAKLSDVTVEQKMQIEVLFLKVAQKIEALKANTDLTDEQKKEYIKGNKKDGERALEAILTEAQNKELEALKVTLGEAKKATDEDIK